MASCTVLSRCMAVILVVGMTVGLTCPGVAAAQVMPLASDGSPVFINEIHYDNDGTDTGEAIEIAGPVGTDLDGWGLVLYNGNGGTSYNTTLLSGIIPDQQDGYGTLYFSYPVNGIQNGSPDGMALVDDSNAVVQFLSYEGSFTATDGPANGMTSVDIGVSESSSTPAGHSLQLAGTGTMYTDFSWASAAENTFGAVNSGQTFGTPSPPPTLASIYDIQYTIDPGGDSPYYDQAVTTQGIVTGTFANGYFIQDPAFASWGGLWVFDDAHSPSRGDLLQLTGTVDEYYNLTELKDLTDFQVLSTSNTLPDPILLNTAAASDEQWEGMLVRVETVTVSDEDLGYGEWEVDDGTGGIAIDDIGGYTYVPVLGEELDFVQGPLNYTYSAFKIAARDDGDISIPLDYTPIYELQFTTDPGGDSPSKGQVVTTEGIVTAVFGSGYFIQDPADSAWSGLWVYDSNTPALGDRLRLTGAIQEYNNLTELYDLTEYQILSSENALPDPVLLSTAGTSDEQWEGMLVRVEAVTVTNQDLGYGEWEVDDGSGGIVVDDMGSYAYSPVDGDALDFIQGPLNYSFGAFKIEPRDDDDIGIPAPPPPPPVSIYEIQYTTDPDGDSPYVGQMVTTQGIVTAFFNAGGSRYTFIQDGPGPWNGLILYKPDGFINVGDLIQVEGEVSEYSGLTQIAYGDVTVLSSGNPLPAPEVLPTFYISQEGLESVLVRVENVTVVNDDLGYGEWSVDDGTGVVLVDDLGSYSYDPMNGDFLDYIQGPLYFSFGDFKIEPRHDGDIGIAPPHVDVCEIQGSGLSSPFVGQTIRTQGLVIADFDQTGKRGFFIQDPDCDGDLATSDGIFVYTGSNAQVVSQGDLVQVRGSVSEYFELTEINTSISNVTILSEENSLPSPVDLNPPFDNDASWVYFESLEGMYVSMDFANVVGPTDAFDETYVVRSDLGLDRIFQDHPDGTGVIVGVDDSGLFEIQPEAKVGDQVTGLLGALDFTFGYYKIQLTAPPMLVTGPDPAKPGDMDGDGDIDLDDLRVITKYFGQRVPPAPDSADLDGDGRITYKDILAFLELYKKLVPTWRDFSVATFNVANFFDTVNEPGKEDPVTSPEAYELKLDKLAEAIHDDLGEPAIIGVQEAENLTVLEDLAARPEIQAEYAAVLVDGPDVRGIDVGLLYRVDQMKVLDYEARQGCTTLVDGFGPDGNSDVENPANDVTCDSNGDGVLDGNRLFSRPPLLVHLEFGRELPRRGWMEIGDLWVIVNHFKSKSQDTEDVQYTLPRRVKQAEFVAGLVREIRASDWGARIIVLGDLNDFLNSETLAVLKDAGLDDLLYEAPKYNRYSYIFMGESEVLDHILISKSLWAEFRSLEPVHINADYPLAFEDSPDNSRRSSDHDPVLARFLMRMSWRGW